MDSFSYLLEFTSGTGDLQYNTTVFSASGLSNSQHELVISTINQSIPGYVNFDYAIYTYVDSMIAPPCGSDYILGLISPIIRPSQPHRLWDF
jgi:hypothetical protein